MPTFYLFINKTIRKCPANIKFLKGFHSSRNIFNNPPTVEVSSFSLRYFSGEKSRNKEYWIFYETRSTPCS